MLGSTEESQRKPQFDSLVGDLRSIFEKGFVDITYPGEKPNLKEVVLWGEQAWGAGYRLRKKLSDRCDFISVSDNDDKIPIKKTKRPVVLYVDLGNFSGNLEKIRDIARQRHNVKILMVDVKGNQHSAIKGFSYAVRADYFLPGFERDIDPAISRMVSELYLNVDFAVDKEGVRFNDGSFVKPYFKTSFLIDYSRSRDILEGILSSVIRKFEPEVIASRKVAGKPPEDDVKMYDLAAPIAERLGLESAMIERDDGIYTTEADIKNKRILLLDDVVGDGKTKLALIRSLKMVGGDVSSCVVLVDRLEGAADRLKPEGVTLYSLTDLKTYERLAVKK